jgi:hypothetical protein
MDKKQEFDEIYEQIMGMKYEGSISDNARRIAAAFYAAGQKALKDRIKVSSILTSEEAAQYFSEKMVKEVEHSR